MRRIFFWVLLVLGGVVLGGIFGAITGWTVGYHWRGADFVYDQSEDILLPLASAAFGGLTGCYFGLIGGIRLGVFIEKQRSAG